MCSPVVQNTDVLTEALKEFATEFPQLMRPLIQERDEYMVFLLRTLALRYDLCKPCTAHLIYKAVCSHNGAYANSGSHAFGTSQGVLHLLASVLRRNTM